MEKKLRRLLVLLTTVVLLVCVLATGVFATEADEPVCYKHGDVNADSKITQRDAIYLLYNVLLDKEQYPVNQDCDFDNSGSVDQNDAFYLLYASFGDSDYPLEKDLIHNYYDPVWTWVDGDASEKVTATFKCGCGQELAYSSVDADNWIEVKEETTAATCLENGSKEWVATFKMNGETYTETKTEIIPATGHSMIGKQDCEKGSNCENCGYELKALGHKWELDEEHSTAATCTTKAAQVYTCSNCGNTKDVTVEGTTAHTYVFDTTVGMMNCEAVNKYKCKDCGEVKPYDAADSYYTHKYTAILTKEATCQQEGTKTYTCSACGDYYTEAIPKNDAHTWVAGVSEGTVTTYSCACGATKTVASAANNTAVDKMTLTAASELQLDKGAAIALDAATVEALDEEATIKITVDEVALSNVNLTDNQKAQVGDNPVYDFNMVSVVNDVETPVTEFDGTVTVSLPYELTENEDIDSIDVWYIADNGTLERMSATYSNGYVTFTTTHFSYYTVTRLTAEERCVRYGHISVESEKDATCTEAGYYKNICQRCGEVAASKNYAAKGHSYIETITPATCTEDGKLVKKCSVESCGHTTSEVIPAKGHSLETTSETTATCTVAGTITKKCADCGFTTTEVGSALGHHFAEDGSKEADCTNGGYTREVCTVCDEESISGETLPLGHAYEAEKDGWTWSEDNSEATITLVCANDNSHTKVLNAVVTEKTMNATCLVSGYTTYTATASYNNITYTTAKTAEGTAAVGHQPAAEWLSTPTLHYHECTACQERVGTEAHTWGEETVTKAATCEANGTAEVTCTICGYTSEKTLPATGEHTYVNGTCSACGKDEGACNHLRTYKTEIDLSAYDLCEGSKIWNNTCECGENSCLTYSLRCDLVESGEESEITLEDGTKVTIWTLECQDCGLVLQNGVCEIIDETECMGYFGEYNRFSFNGNVIGEGIYLMGETEEHPMVGEPYKIIDMADYGLCEGTVQMMTCYCGKNIYAETAEEGCRWTFEKDDSDSQTFRCAVCGAVEVETWTAERNEEICEETSRHTIVYYLNDAVVLELNTASHYYSHDYAYASHELYGETCEDGLLYTMKCQVCGKLLERYVTWHAEIISTVTDLSDAAICADSLTQYSCPCSEQYMWYELLCPEDSWCEWIFVSEEENVRVYTCEICGATRTRTTTYGEKNENCVYQIKDEEVFTDAEGNVIATGINSYSDESHNMKTTGKLLVENGSCTDGVSIVQICEDCGWSYDYTEYGHVGIVKQTYDVSGLDMCTDTVAYCECVCGASSWLDVWRYCDWTGIGGTEFSDTEVCSNCGVTMTISWENLEQADDCHVKRAYTYLFEKEGRDSVAIKFEQTNAVHTNITFTMVLLDGATDCNGGFDVTMHCSACGTSEYYGTWYDHTWFPIAVETLSEGELCGTLKRETVSCACGYNTWTNIIWIDGQCNFEWTSYDDETGVTTSTCTVCGAVRTSIWTDTPIEGQTCIVNRTENYTYYDKDGVELFSCEETGSSEQHADVCTFAMNGTICEDGYRVIRTCQACGEVRDSGEIYYNCESWCISRELLYDGTESCGKVYLCQYSSPCGEINSWNVEGPCRFDWVGWNENESMELWVCQKCGLQMGQIYYTEQIENSCSANRTWDVVLILNGEEIASAHKEYVTIRHQTVCAFQMLGTSCEDGYYLTEKCVYCDYSHTDEFLHYGHENFIVGYYDLKAYGMCGGEVIFEACPCGQNSNGGTSNWNCNWYNTGEVDAQTGCDILKCYDCGIYYVNESTGSIDTETCTYNGTMYVKIFGAEVTNEPLLNVSHQVFRENHEDVATSFVMMNPEGSCEDGVTATYECVNCGRTGTTTYWEHRNWLTETLDLSEYPDTCGGIIRAGQCACGRDSFLDEAYACENMSQVDDWYEEDAEGIGHHFWKYTCGVCGLTKLEEGYTVENTENCTGVGYETNTFTLNDEELKTFNLTWNYDAHDYVASAVLMDGSQSCEDGVIITQNCSRCGQSYRYQANDHTVVKQDSIDLADYGSACGAQLNFYHCACGAYSRYSMDNDSACDLDYQGIENWIDGTINDGQCTSNGWQGYWSNSNLIKCAVSDPACGLTIRMSEYWLKNGCEVTEYQTWQLGYDETTGTCQQEYTIATGEKHAYHSYESTSISETLEDGTTVSSWSYVCPDCGSYYTEKNYHLNGVQTKYERNAVNMLDNGENRQYTYIVNYDYVYNGYSFATRSYEEFIRADGSVYWSSNDFTYHHPDSCMRTGVYSDSYGSSRNYTEDAHVGSWYSDSKEPTCTQFGFREQYGYCDVCGGRWDYYYEELEPTCHDWHYEEDIAKYRCWTCGLESTQGASGAIVMQDLSEVCGQGFGYVVGYWNRENIEFVPNISVVLEGSTAEDNVIDLSGIGFAYWDAETQEATAIYCDKATVDAAAEAAMTEAGYTGSYAIRITFVPVNYEDDLDYAITFDSHTFEGQSAE